MSLLRARGLRRLSTSVLHHTTDVRLALDTGPITPLLRKCGALDASDDIAQVRQFSHGQSNPTFTVRWADRAVVVRKQPGGKLLKGAHDVGREYQFASHLGKKGVPTPHALALCDDTDILGTRFWVYDYVDGRHFRDPYLERASVDERPLLYKSAARAAATLHGARRRPIAASTASAMARGTSSAMWPGQQRCRRSSRINGLPASGL